jgi:hypothetical protein
MKLFIKYSLIVGLISLSCNFFAQFTKKQTGYMVAGQGNLMDWSKLPDEYCKRIDAATDYSDEYALFFNKGNMFFYPLKAGVAELAPVALNTFSGWPGWDKVDAAVSWGDETLLFNKNKCVTFNSEQKVTDLGAWTDLPWAGVHAAVRKDENTIWLMYFKEYLEYDIKAQKASPVKKLATLAGFPESWEGVAGAVNIGDGHLYFFRKGEVLAYSLSANKCVIGYPKRIKPTATNPASADADSPSTATNNDPPKPKPNQGKYRDDYAEGSIGSTSFDVKALPNSDWLGAGIDIVYVDPLRLESQEARKDSPIKLTISPERIADQQHFKHYGTRYKSLYTSTASEKETMVKTVDDLRKSFANQIAVSASGEIDVARVGGGSFAFSGSTSFKNLNAKKIGKDNIAIMARAKRVTHSLSLDVIWPPDDSDGSFEYRQKLDAKFRRDVNNLPSSGNDLSAYQQLIDTWGTHFATEVTFGGVRTSTTVISKDMFDNSNLTAEEFGIAASASMHVSEFGLASAGGSVSGSYNEQASKFTAQAREAMKSNTERYCSGGNGDCSDYSSWVKSVNNKMDGDGNAMPIAMKYDCIITLVSDKFFPNDANIRAKRQLLFNALLAYFDKKGKEFPDAARLADEFYKGKYKAVSDGYYYIEVQRTGFMSANAERNDDKVTTANNEKKLSQIWRIMPSNTKGWYKIKLGTGKVLEVEGGAPTDGNRSKIFLRDEANTDNQLFRFEADDFYGAVKIMTKGKLKFLTFCESSSTKGKYWARESDVEGSFQQLMKLIPTNDYAAAKQSFDQATAASNQAAANQAAAEQAARDRAAQANQAAAAQRERDRLAAEAARRPATVKVFCQAGYVANFNINGESFSLSAGKSKTISVPPNQNINLKGYVSMPIGSDKKIFNINQSFAPASNTCYKVFGTFSDPEMNNNCN